VRIALGLLFLVALGCGPSESAVIGEWKGQAELTKEQQNLPLSNLATGLAASFSLNMKEDHTFRMVATLVPVEGTWKMEGSQVVLTPKEVLGFQTIDKTSNTITLRLTPDNRRLEPATPDDQKATRGFVFVKSP
jgi:hypothetical protein